jgi:tetratricopeptide (TPR) repeat protein
MQDILSSFYSCAVSIGVMTLAVYALLSFLAAWQEAASIRETGQRAYRSGNYVEAESLFRAALDAAKTDDGVRAGILSDLGTLLLDEERLPEAEDAYKKALALRKTRFEAGETAVVLRDLGALYSLERQDHKAISVLQEASKVALSFPDAPELKAKILNSQGVAYFRAQRFGKAEQLFQEGLDILADKENLSDSYAAPLLNNLGAVYCEQRKFSLAEQFMTQALALTEKEFGPMHPALTDTLDGLGFTYMKMGRFADAESQYLRSIAILEKNKLMPSDIRIARAHQALADVYAHTGDKNKAAIEREHAARIEHARAAMSLTVSAKR